MPDLNRRQFLKGSGLLVGTILVNPTGAARHLLTPLPATPAPPVPEVLIPDLPEYDTSGFEEPDLQVSSRPTAPSFTVTEEGTYLITAVASFAFKPGEPGWMELTRDDKVLGVSYMEGPPPSPEPASSGRPLPDDTQYRSMTLNHIVHAEPGDHLEVTAFKGATEAWYTVMQLDGPSAGVPFFNQFEQVRSPSADQARNSRDLPKES